jgi:HicA-like toxin of HicAB toxin-antitoxin system
MPRTDRTLERVLSGRADANIGFADLRRLLLRLGFVERVRGDHHIFSHDGITEILNLQPLGAQAKPYQVKQVRQRLVRYQLGGDDDG